LLHNHANQDANCLPQSPAASGVYLRQESVKGGLRLKFSNDTSQRGAVMVQLRFRHSPLAVGVVKELQHGVERILRIVHDVGKLPSLSIFQKPTPRHQRF
jgi:hypothetical protein